MKFEIGKETYVLDDIPFEERRIIDELVNYWQTRYEPRDLTIHIDKLPSTWGQHRVRNFFRQVYEDLCTDQHSKYVAFSASKFEGFLETEYSQRAQTHGEHQAQVKAEAERQAQVEAKEREEYEKRARADFDALGKEMAKATTRAECVKSGRKRAALEPYIGSPAGSLLWP